MTPLHLSFVAERLAREPAVLVTVERSEGSVPREAGTHMVVFAGEVVGTIGGGQLEYQAIAQAKSRIGAADAQVLRYPLGPTLGQCCGGVVWLRFERLDAVALGALSAQLREALQPLALFGGGHVGRALVDALAPLPYAVTWIDSREAIFPAEVPAHVACEHSDPVQAAVPQLAPGSQVLVMSFSHAEDLDIVAACLRRRRERADLPFIGLIGSRTKWQTFRHRLEQRGFTPAELAQVTCPIGILGITGKEPAVIAASVAAQLLLLRPAR
ncbi:xanthine dehydrogenase accessory protein XdhC [Ramlibacter rhizophilus]|uniref:Xanthine dehydrogenase accessory protein XdhC n=1 Tax=Ramlibacter rhizophilus TaxID=1781167 RepID=A0A4Z0BQX0_9BURK|nr:xanthine dehydrogenase accessory protein XdhC [Ramlibacter rhizophilus]TFZ01231.1 xanthine dehydrogenase accessory protein XdhC [Ramlibacter rhizophilus]